MKHLSITAFAWPTPRSARWLAVALSLLWSLIVCLRNPILNDDAYGYLRAASLFQSDGIDAVLHNYGWYGYSIIIALLDYVLPGDLLFSAQLFNALTLSLLVLAFIECSYSLQPAPYTRGLAALTILLFPMLNEMRYFLIRDFGFWSLALCSLWQLVRYSQIPHWRTGALWCISLALATVFRLEAMLLALLAPLWLWQTTGTKAALKLYAILGALGTLLLLLSLLLKIDVLALMQFAYRYYLPSLFNLPDVLKTEALGLTESLFTSSNFPGTNSIQHGLALLVLDYLYTLFANLVAALGLVPSILMVYAYWHGWLRNTYQKTWIGYFFISALSLLVFLSIMHFLTQRYATLLCLLILLLMPTTLYELYYAALLNNRLRWLRLSAALLVLAFLIDSFISFGYSQSYLSQAVAWTNTNLPAQTTLLTNNFYIAYESHRVSDYDKINTDLRNTLQEVKSNQILILVISGRDKDNRALLDSNTSLTLLQSFANKREDEARIYRMQ